MATAHARVVPREPSSSTAGKGKGKGKGKVSTPPPAKTPHLPAPYAVEQSEYKGHPLLQFWHDKNQSRWADLQLGVKKLRVVLAVAEDEELLKAVRDFLEEHDTQSD